MPGRRTGRPAGAPLQGWRRWAFPAAAAILAPLLTLAGLELTLRLAGVGHPPGFLVPVPGRAAETTNPRFGERFFPPALARQPVVERLPDPKPEDSYRIFLLGGSAAMGTPEPSFGLGRVLEVLLEARYPETDFQVVNAAMAAINSHVVREVAADCVRRQPDLIAVYLGNNEVVGPYGPGTVFAQGDAGLGMIRLGLWLRRLRTGQLLSRGLALLRRPAETVSRWRGMEMFLDRRVTEDDPRLAVAYERLGDNLGDIVRLASRRRVPLLLSTVAVDLRDTPPFASAHRPDLPASQLDLWRQAVDEGARLAGEGRAQEALGHFRQALSIDDQHAELHYRIGRLELAAQAGEPARHHLTRARDLDALRFRADSRINEIIRRVAATGVGEIRLVDGERRLGEAPESRYGMPGRELFWEHVHLRFLGNYRLAAAFLEPLEELLPDGPRGSRKRGIPTPEQAAEILALTPAEQWRMADSIHRMTRRPPFTGQLDHGARQLASKRARQGARALAEAAAEASLSAYRRALEKRPDDLHLQQLLARALADRGDVDQAVIAWRTLVDRLPGVPAWHTQLGFALAAAGDHGAALEEHRRVLESHPASIAARVNLARTLARSGDAAAAESLYRDAIDRSPADEAARGNLAELLEERGEPAAAERQYRELLELDPESATAHRRLGELLARQDRREAAMASYREALRLDPELAPVHNNLGYLLAESGRFEEAVQEYLAALDDDPRYALAYFNLADLLLGLGRASDAAEAYRAGLALRPDNDQARANLQQALRLAGNG